LDSLRAIILACLNVEEKVGDPFAVDVVDGLMRLKEILPNLSSFGELALDGEAFFRLVVILGLQERLLKDRMTSLYSDPFLIGLKLRAASVDGLSEAFLKSWRTVASSECMNYEMLKESYVYWTNLRRIRLEGGESEPEEVDAHRLEEMGLREGYDLASLIRQEHERLKSMGEEISYDQFIDSPNPDERLRRAVLLSYMITFGYADARLDPIESRVWVKAKDEPSIPQMSEKFSIVYKVTRIG